MLKKKMKTNINTGTRIDGKVDVIFTRSDGKQANVGLTSEELEEMSNQICDTLSLFTLDKYQQTAKSTCTDNSYSYSYLGDGIVEELGEFKGKIAKMVRKAELPVNFTREDVMNLDEDKRKALMLELGDMLWFTAVLADWFGWSLNDVCKANKEKLESRVKNNTIIGEGDNR